MSKAATRAPSAVQTPEQRFTPPKVKRRGRGIALEMSSEQGRQISGTDVPDFIETLANQLALATPGQSAKSVNAGLAALTGIQPRDELEAMLAAQMTAVHSMSMEMARRALLPEQTVEGVTENVSRASRLMRTFCAQIEALQRYRNAGQSTVTVQHVTVAEGGQAVIGNVGKGDGAMGEWRGKPHEQIPRCGAKTRAGHPCKRFAMSNGRCEFHGGKSTGPKDLSKWHLKHGRFSKATIAERKQFAALLRDVRESLRTMEILE